MIFPTPLVNHPTPLGISLGTDALPANHCVLAAEHAGWSDLRNQGDANALATLQYETNCLHHQASLAKKPGLLQIDGLCSSMVRFARAMRSSKFQVHFSAGLDFISKQVDRRVVPVLPATVLEWQTKNKWVCQLLATGLDEKNTELLLKMFNGNWRDSFEESASWTHYCCGCCANHEETVLQARECLRNIFEYFPQIPLLYRWKGWESIQGYVGFGILLHNFLPFLVKQCVGSSQKVYDLLEQDVDSADFSIALKQEVRMGKTLAFITSDTIRESQQSCILPFASSLVEWSGCMIREEIAIFGIRKNTCLEIGEVECFFKVLFSWKLKEDIGTAVLVAGPLTSFMDALSFIESARQRVYLKSRGLSLPKSTCTATAAEIQALNWDVLSGLRALEVTAEFTAFLELHPQSELLTSFGLTFELVFPRVFSTMCDSYRRLCLPPLQCKSRILQIAFMSVEDAADYLKMLSTVPECCSGHPFVQASGVQQELLM
eukprot:s714_g13.t1